MYIATLKMDTHIKRAELIGRYIHDARECSFRIDDIGDTMLYVTIEGDKELLKILSELVGAQCRMNACYFRLTPDQYDHFMNDVLDKNVAWTITTKTAWYQPNKTITIPGTWTRKLIDGGRRKRSGRKRSGRKRSGRKRSGRKRSGRKRSQRTATRRRKI
jgi:hypothetical protein